MRTRSTYSTFGSKMSGTYLANKAMKPLTYPTDRTSTYPEKWIQDFYNTGQVIVGFEFTSPLVKKNKTNSTWNAFQHYKMLIDYSNPKGIATSFNPFGFGATYGYKCIIPVNAVTVAPAFGGNVNPISGLTPLYTGSGKDVSLTDTAGLSNLRTSAAKQMLPGIKPKLYSGAELYQVKDMASILRTAARARDLVKAIEVGTKLALTIKKGPHFVKNAHLPLAKLLLALPADLYLQWKFNIMPLLGDIAAVKSSLSTVAEQVTKLLAEQNRRLTKHYSRSLEGSYKNVETRTNAARNSSFSGQPPYGTYSTLFGGLASYNSPPIIIPITNDTRKVRHVAVFHAEIQYSYYFAEVENDKILFNSYLDSLGIGVNPLLELWELIPWSFVVDWVINVSELLKNLEHKHVKPVTVIHNWCWSQNINRFTTILSDLKGTGGYEVSYSMNDTEVCRVTETAYKRGIDGFSISTALQGSGISQSEFILASALAITRLH